MPAGDDSPGSGCTVCLVCLELRGPDPRSAHDHCGCTRFLVPAADYPEARLPAQSLCIVCSTGTAGAPHRWAWLACRDCREADTRLAGLIGLRRTGLPLGRHSIMNGAAVALDRGELDAQAQHLSAALHDMTDLRDRAETRARALADEHFPGQRGTVRLATWQGAIPPGPPTSTSALIDLLRDARPLRHAEILDRHGSTETDRP